MKTFNDLVFTKTENGLFDRAYMAFNNGQGVSVVRTNFLKHSANSPISYELAVMKNGEIDYTTEITNDVIPYLEPDEVTKIMERVQMLPPR